MPSHASATHSHSADEENEELARLREENAQLALELSTTRADVEVLQTRLAEIGSLRRHTIRTLIDSLRRADSIVQRGLTPPHPFEPAQAPEALSSDVAALLDAAHAADRSTVQAYRSPPPRSRLLMSYRRASRRLYGAAVDRYRRLRRTAG